MQPGYCAGLLPKIHPILFLFIAFVQEIEPFLFVDVRLRYSAI
jgi:hypothetical protein